MSQVKSRIPSVKAYRDAFLVIQDKITPKQRAMLVAHHHAPDRTMTMSKLAAAVGFKSHNGAVLQYGTLGRRLCKVLRYKPTMFEHGHPVWTSVLADAPEARSTEQWEWTLRPEVASALEHLGWVEGKSRLFVFLWNPEHWDWGAEYLRGIRATAKGRPFRRRWSSGNRKDIEEGERIFLFRQSADG